MPRSTTCIFTIAARNYLHAVRAFMDSAARHAPEADLVLGLCDRAEASEFAGDRFSVVGLSDLNLPDAHRFIFQYTLLELSTAIKPHVFDRLFRERGYEKIIYFDPDILVYHDLSAMLRQLDEADVLLTPHITAPIDDGSRPSEREILSCGTFNLGFLGLRRSEDTSRFLAWWKSKMERDCVVDFARGLFVDQKWMDFVPSFLSRAAICRDPGWNTAYWNLPSRQVAMTPRGYEVNGAPLVFYHFSGLDPRGGVFSRHQDRFTLDALPGAVPSLVRDYVLELEKHGYPETARIPYAHAAFPDGTPIPDLARRIFREAPDDLRASFGDMLGEGAGRFQVYLNEPAREGGRTSPLVTRLAYAVIATRADLGLPRQFPDALGAQAPAYATWFAANAQEFCALPEYFIQPVRSALARQTEAGAEDGLGQRIYKLAWKYKNLTHAFLPLETRQKIHARLFRHAYVRAASTTGAAPRHTFDGLNVIGYLRAELGVGEAARATLRACSAAKVPFSRCDFQQGSISRMEEELPPASLTQPEFGVNVVHLNAEQIPLAVAHFGEALFRDRYTIAVWNWELPHLPDEWLEVLQFIDEIWAPTAFCHSAFSRRVDIPVTHIPYSLDIQPPAGVGRKDLGLPDDGSFLFLFMFDAFSQAERKNPLGLLRAYREAQPAFRRKVRLVLKVINGNQQSDCMAQLRAAAAADPTIHIIDRYLHRPELNALFEAADCYVSLHRSEGFGLTLAEAMFLGKLAIGTGWSGNMDFMTPWNALLVPYRLVELDRDHGPYRQGQTWADPDLAAAAQLMARAVNEPELSRVLGRRAAEDMRNFLSPAAVGRLIAQRLAALRQLGSQKS